MNHIIPLIPFFSRCRSLLYGLALSVCTICGALAGYCEETVLEYDFSNRYLWEKTTGYFYKYSNDGKIFRLGGEWLHTGIYDGYGNDYIDFGSSAFIVFPKYDRNISKVVFVTTKHVSMYNSAEVEVGTYPASRQDFIPYPDSSKYDFPTDEGVEFAITNEMAPFMNDSEPFAVRFNNYEAYIAAVKVYLVDDDAPVGTHLTVDTPDGEYANGQTVSVSCDNADATIFINDEEQSEYTLAFTESAPEVTLDIEARDKSGETLCRETHTYTWKSAPVPVFTPEIGATITAGQEVAVNAEGAYLTVSYTPADTEHHFKSEGNDRVRFGVYITANNIPLKIRLTATATADGLRPSVVTYDTTIDRSNVAEDFTLEVTPDNNNLYYGDLLHIRPASQSAQTGYKILYSTAPVTFFSYNVYDDNEGILISESEFPAGGILYIFAVLDDGRYYALNYELNPQDRTEPVTPLPEGAVAYKPVPSGTTTYKAVEPSFVDVTDDNGRPVAKAFANYYILAGGDRIMTNSSLHDGAEYNTTSDNSIIVMPDTDVLEFALIPVSGSDDRYLMFIPGTKTSWPAGTDEATARAEWLAAGSYSSAADWRHNTTANAPAEVATYAPVDTPTVGTNTTADMREAQQFSVKYGRLELPDKKTATTTHKIVYDKTSRRFTCSCNNLGDAEQSASLALIDTTGKNGGLSTGVSTVSVDETTEDTTPVWYTLQGVRLEDHPTRPGAYIDATTRRIIIIR